MYARSGFKEFVNEAESLERKVIESNGLRGMKSDEKVE